MKVTITLEDSLAKLIPALQQIADLQAHELAEQKVDSVDSDQAEEEPQSWNEDRVRLVWRDLSVGCKEILTEIAQHEDGIKTDELMGKLNLTSYVVGGRLSSLGHQLRIHKCGKLRYPVDWVSGSTYRMIPIWKDIVSKIEKG